MVPVVEGHPGPAAHQAHGAHHGLAARNACGAGPGRARSAPLPRRPRLRKGSPTRRVPPVGDSDELSQVHRACLTPSPRSPP